MKKTQNSYAYSSSNPNVICDVCGKKRKWSEVEHAYGSGDLPVVISCRDGCADYRHPLNSPPPVIFDAQPILDARPEGTDVFIYPTGQDVWNRDPRKWQLAPNEFSTDPNYDAGNWENP